MRRQLIAAAIIGFAAASFAPTVSEGAETPTRESEKEDSLSRADALAKAGRHAEALAIIEPFLAENPEHTGARILFARTLAWKGEYDRAISIYSDVIKKNPGHAEAHAGLAAVLSWKKDYKRSVEEYRQSLFIEPRSNENRMGLARTLWWKGDIEDALRELSVVLAREPGNKEAQRLERRLRQEKGPFARASYSNSIDSDQSRLQVSQLVFNNTFGLKGHRFEFAYKFFDTSLPGRSANASTFDVRDSIKFGNGATLTPRLGLVSLNSNVSDTAYMTEGLGLSMPVARRTDMTIAYNRYPLLDTARLIENNIRVEEASFGVLHDIKRTTLSASAVFADYSDGNSRYDITGGVAVNVMDEPRVIAGLASEYRDFAEKAANGYFNPPHIFSNTVYIDAFGNLWRGLDYRAKATAGIQSFEGKSDYTTSFQAGLEWTASRDLWFDAGYKYSRSAIESASGFRFEEFRAGVNYFF